MTRRIRLTLISVCLVALLTGTISAYYLKTEIDKRFLSALQRAESMKNLAADSVARSLDRSPSVPIPDALASDEDLAGRLSKIMTFSDSLIEITICDSRNRVLLSTDPSRRRGDPFPRDYGDYRALATRAAILEKIRVLRDEGTPRFYQLSGALGPEGQSPDLYVRVVILPGLLRSDILPELEKAGIVSLLSILGSILIALVFSNFAFRPLSNVSKMLDHLTRGQYESPESPRRSAEREDEFGVMVSKVNLLGQQLGNFERLLDQLEEAVLVFGQDGRLIVASGALEKFIGKRRVELMGLTRTEIFPPDASVGFRLEQLLETGRPVRNFSVRLGGVNGSYGPAESQTKLSHALLSVELVESFASGTRKNTGIMVRLRDPEVRRQIKGQLQTAERLTAINRVTSGVAHEVKNPLNAMLMHVELARIKLAKGDHDVSQQMDIISSEIVRLDRVVKTFLDFTRPVEVKSTEVPVDSFVSELVELARPQAQAVGVTVSSDLHAPGATIVVDSDLLKQAALNIVVNGIEAMPQGGELRFESSMTNEEAEIRISDSGGGIPPDKRDKIFQLYFTTKKKGSGIGLAMTFRIVQLHNGKIDFSSEPGKGTTFTLRFPLEGVAQ
ncbi:MAG TPA: ATP-binding protein [Bryobacteraceae bacterium]|nr:ATP-binding protein [Bryobacteraceae bacterium]